MIEDTANAAIDEEKNDAIDFDLPCVHCGYNLRGLTVAHNRPECGTPAARSARSVS